MSEAAVFTVEGSLRTVQDSGFTNKTTGEKGSMLTAIFDGEDARYPVVVTVPRAEADAARRDLMPLVGQSVCLLISPGDFRKIWYRGIAA